MPTAMGLMASWKAGNKAMEIQCLMYLAYVRVFQGRLQGVAFGREVLGKSRELPERAEAMGSPALSLGLLASGEYEEALEVCLRGTELARKRKTRFCCGTTSTTSGGHTRRYWTCRRRVRSMRRRWSLGDSGAALRVLSSASLCAVAALSEVGGGLPPRQGGTRSRCLLRCA